MLDLSKYAENKDSYIVSIAIDELFDKFKVTYASGRIEEHDFSIHNYQVYSQQELLALLLYEDEMQPLYHHELGRFYRQQTILLRQQPLWQDWPVL